MHVDKFLLCLNQPSSLVRTAHICVPYDCAQFSDKDSKPITPLTAATSDHQSSDACWTVGDAGFSLSRTH